MSTPSDPTQTAPAANDSDPRAGVPGGVRVDKEPATGSAKIDATPKKLAYELTDVEVHYGPVKAVQGVTFDLGENEI
ncbi:MAG: hypothetical protein M3445_08640, partial [Actinomycetota bacterium]|nr:hypothetical protein [Actinomycetota bacterium]